MSVIFLTLLTKIQIKENSVTEPPIFKKCYLLYALRWAKFGGLSPNVVHGQKIINNDVLGIFFFFCSRLFLSSPFLLTFNGTTYWCSRTIFNYRFKFEPHSLAEGCPVEIKRRASREASKGLLTKQITKMSLNSIKQVLAMKISFLAFHFFVTLYFFLLSNFVFLQKKVSTFGAIWRINLWHVARASKLSCCTVCIYSPLLPLIVFFTELFLNIFVYYI